MPSEEKLKEYKARLDNELKVINSWLDYNPDCLSPEQIASYDRVQRVNVIEAHQKECEENKARKADIEAALVRIGAGTFGICMGKGCGREIDQARLEGDLVRKYCINCQVERMTAKRNGARNKH